MAEMVETTSVRLPRDLYSKLKAVAVQERRSLNGELVKRLERTFENALQPAAAQ